MVKDDDGGTNQFSKNGTQLILDIRGDRREDKTYLSMYKNGENASIEMGSTWGFGDEVFLYMGLDGIHDEIFILSGIKSDDQCSWTPRPTTPEPTLDTAPPTWQPSAEPSQTTMEPTFDPTMDPTNDPTVDPTTDPTDDPTNDPSMDPTMDPIGIVTMDPSTDPSMDPSNYPTLEPTDDPTMEPIESDMSKTNEPTQSPDDEEDESVEEDEKSDSNGMQYKWSVMLGFIMTFSLYQMFIV